MSSDWENNEEIKYFREYLRIPSVHPNVDCDPCIKFLQNQADNLQLPLNIYYPGDPKRPIVVITWTGTQPNLPSIVLNSHMDVVPVFEENWTYPPFSATIDKEGRIFARGSQDMKCVGMQYLAAIRALKKDGITALKRTIHIVFVPDEEIGGFLGMKKFVRTKEFEAMNVGFALDEGLASPNDVFSVSYGERVIWRVYFKCSGTAGHGSLLLKNTAGEKVNYLLDKFMNLRKKSIQKLIDNPEFTTGDVTSINLTIIDGGVQSNVVPPLLTIVFDIRLALDEDLTEFEAMYKRWCEEAGGGIEIYYEQKENYCPPTKIDDTNQYWIAFKSAVDELQLKIKPQVFVGGTDSRYIREIGIPAIGFSPIINTPILLHDHDEFLQADVYLRGINIYKKIITKVANV